MPSSVASLFLYRTQCMHKVLLIIKEIKGDVTTNGRLKLDIKTQKPTKWMVCILPTNKLIKTLT